MDCPRCGQPSVTGPSCPRCGVIFAKLRDRPPRPPASAALGEGGPQADAGRRSLLAPLLLILLAAAGAAWLLRSQPRSSAPTARPAPAVIGASPASAPDVTAGPILPAAAPVPLPSTMPEGGLSAADADAARSLTQRLALHAPVSQADIATAEALCNRYPNQGGLRDLLAATLVAVANQDRQARRYDPASAGLRRAIGLRPSDVGLRLALVSLLSEAADWAGAEAAARELLAMAPRNPDALEALAFALFRQDRNREALEALHDALDIRPSASAQALQARIEKGLQDEQGMTEQHVAHFDVRYDGDAHAEVGREILRELERHYATLATTFDYEPKTTIAVILFTRQAYYDAAGAPAWSGGVFDNIDGRIRIPVLGVTPALSREMDGTLIHELTHAFIFEMSRGVAPRDLHEGVAQYMEGKRIASMLSPGQITALADGRIDGVDGFYLGALSFAEYIFAIRGQGGVNDLLRAMGETGNLDESFRRVYGQDYASTRQAWADRLRQQYGS